jgi:hypothetical protein
MTGGSMDPNDPNDRPPPADPDPPDEAPRFSKYERFDIPVPIPAKGPKRRPPVVTTAAVVLLVSALFYGLGVALLEMAGSSGNKLAGVQLSSSASTVLFLGLGAFQAAAGLLVLALRPVGRTLGITLAIVGIALALLGAASDAVNTLLSLALNGFVIYALATSRSSFTRG